MIKSVGSRCPHCRNNVAADFCPEEHVLGELFMARCPACEKQYGAVVNYAVIETYKLERVD